VAGEGDDLIARWGASAGARVRQLRSGDTLNVSQPALPLAAPPGQFQPAWTGQILAPFGIVNPDPTPYATTG
jgi:hypothetical protein